MSKIFISYRRDDTNDISGRIYDRLRSRYGQDRVFKDVFDIAPGEAFGERIRAELASCAAVLVIMGKNWVDLADESTGKRRLDEDEDYVRLEVDAALKRGAPVIPVLVKDAKMPSSGSLPEVIRGLAALHATRIRDDPDFDIDMARLNRHLDRHLSPGASENNASEDFASEDFASETDRVEDSSTEPARRGPHGGTTRPRDEFDQRHPAHPHSAAGRRDRAENPRQPQRTRRREPSGELKKAEEGVVVELLHAIGHQTSMRLADWTIGHKVSLIALGCLPLMILSVGQLLGLFTADAPATVERSKAFDPHEMAVRAQREVEVERPALLSLGRRALLDASRANATPTPSSSDRLSWRTVIESRGDLRRASALVSAVIRADQSAPGADSWDVVVGMLRQESSLLGIEEVLAAVEVRRRDGGSAPNP